MMDLIDWMGIVRREALDEAIRLIERAEAGCADIVSRPALVREIIDSIIKAKD